MMLKPPFTILILKDSQKPVTINVTALLLIFVFAVIPLFTGIAGFAISYSIMKHKDQNVPEAGPGFTVRMSEIKDSGRQLTGGDGAGNLTATLDENGKFGVEMNFSAGAGEDSLYVWVIVNPDADMPSERVISPRNPIRKGMPVDYRNGFLCYVTADSKLKISCDEDLTGIEIEKVQIIAYSKAGKFISKQTFAGRKNV